MFELEQVLHKRTLPTDGEMWHIILQGHPEELLDALVMIMEKEPRVIQTAEWIADDELIVCLHWIDDVIRDLVEQDIHDVNFNIIINRNGREQCHGHNLSVYTT